MAKIDKAMKVATIIFNILAAITFIVLLIDLWVSYATEQPVSLVTAICLTISTVFAIAVIAFRLKEKL